MLLQVVSKDGVSCYVLLELLARYYCTTSKLERLDGLSSIAAIQDRYLTKNLASTQTPHNSSLVLALIHVFSFVYDQFKQLSIPLGIVNTVELLHYSTVDSLHVNIDIGIVSKFTVCLH